MHETIELSFTVNGQERPNPSTQTAHATEATCGQITHGSAQATKPPSGTNARKATCAAKARPRTSRYLRRRVVLAEQSEQN